MSAAEVSGSPAEQALKYYVHPAVFDAYTAGTMLELLQNGTNPTGKTGLDPDETAVAGLLHRR